MIMGAGEELKLVGHVLPDLVGCRLREDTVMCCRRGIWRFRFISVCLFWLWVIPEMLHVTGICSNTGKK